jgi:Protein of unknown function (DUF3102)
MTTDITISNSLADLAARIKAEHEAVGHAMKRGLGHAIAAGEMLIEAKSRLAHGQWLPWLDSCGVSERLAQRYIRLARNRAVIEANPTPVSDLGIRGALDLISVRREPKEEMTALSANLADRGAEMAFDWQALDDINERAEKREVEQDEQRKLLDEAEAAAVRVGELGERYPALAEIIDGGDEVERINAAIDELKAALAADRGLSLEVYDKILAAIDDGASAWSVAEKFSHEIEESNLHSLRLGMPSAATAVVTSVRDISIGWLARVESAAASMREAAP